ncbi:MAG: hypothetical protein ABR927_18805 [Bacteroidales bacterium]
MKPNTILDNISRAIRRKDPYAEVFLFGSIRLSRDLTLLSNITGHPLRQEIIDFFLMTKL